MQVKEENKIKIVRNFEGNNINRIKSYEIKKQFI